MRSLGTKSIAVSVLLVLLILLLIRQDLLSLENLSNLSAEAAVSIGIFTVLGAAWAFRFLRLGDRSGSYFRVDSGQRWESEEVVFRIAKYSLFIGQIEKGQAPPSDFSPALMRGMV